MKMDILTQLLTHLAIALVLIVFSPIFLNVWYKAGFSINVEFALNIIIYTNLIGFLLYFVSRTLDFFLHFSPSSNEQQSDQSVPTITIRGKNQGEELLIPKENLICVSTNGHYIDIFFIDQKSKNMKKVVFRNSILAIVDSFKDHPEFIQCHRSHLINLSHVKNLIGNSKKMDAKLEGFADKIPISRSKITELEARLKIRS